MKLTEEEVMRNWETTDKPVVSICSITFNHKAYIEEAIDSILMQKTDFPFEIILRDDCSTDGTDEIVQRYAEAFPHIVKPVLEKENQFSKGVNPFLAIYGKAEGDYVCILECDDYWTDEYKLQKQVDFLKEHPEYVISYHDTMVVDESGKIVEKSKIENLRDYSETELLCAEAYIPTNTVMFRNVHLDFPSDLYGRMNVINGDTIVWHLLGYYGKGKYQKEIGPAAYRVHSGGVWSGIAKLKRIENSYRTQHLLIELLKKHDRKELIPRMEKNIYRMLAARIEEALRKLDFTLLSGLNRLIVNDPDLSLPKTYSTFALSILNRFRAKISS